MHHPEAIILRRCCPVPVTFADLRCAHAIAMKAGWENIDREYKATLKAMREGQSPPTPSTLKDFWPAALKEATGALDEVYAVVDGREERVAIVDNAAKMITMRDGSNIDRPLNDLLAIADRAGYWERPHEVRLDLEARPVSHDAVARAVLVGQEYRERHGGGAR